MRRVIAIGLLLLVTSGCARTVFSTDDLPAVLDGVVARHPGALRDAPEPARDLVDDLIQTWRAWGGE